MATITDVLRKFTGDPGMMEVSDELGFHKIGFQVFWIMALSIMG